MSTTDDARRFMKVHSRHLMSLPDEALDELRVGLANLLEHEISSAREDLLNKVLEILGRPAYLSARSRIETEKPSLIRAGLTKIPSARAKGKQG